MRRLKQAFSVDSLPTCSLSYSVPEGANDALSVSLLATPLLGQVLAGQNKSAAYMRLDLADNSLPTVLFRRTAQLCDAGKPRREMDIRERKLVTCVLSVPVRKILSYSCPPSPYGPIIALLRACKVACRLISQTCLALLKNASLASASVGGNSAFDLPALLNTSVSTLYAASFSFHNSRTFPETLMAPSSDC